MAACSRGAAPAQRQTLTAIDEQMKEFAELLYRYYLQCEAAGLVRKSPSNGKPR